MTLVSLAASMLTMPWLSNETAAGLVRPGRVSFCADGSCPPDADSQAPWPGSSTRPSAGSWWKPTAPSTRTTSTATVAAITLATCLPSRHSGWLSTTTYLRIHTV